MLRRPPTPTLFPYATLFRSGLTGMQKPGEYLKGLGKELTHSLTDPIKSFGLLREYAVRKAKQTVPYGRTQITKAHESRSEEHTSALQSQPNLVCRLLLAKQQ